MGEVATQARYSGILGWTNSFYRDETQLLLENIMRPYLAVGANRTVQAVSSDDSSLKQIEFGVPDENRHLLTLHLDSANVS